MTDCVEEIKRECHPIINSNSIKVYDDTTGNFYVYGGIRWPNNENSISPTCKPTADFFCFYPHPMKKWRNFTSGMREDESFISPFEETLSRPEKMDLKLPKLGSLPALEDPIGTIIRDDTAAKTSYLLILGDPVGKAYDNYSHPVLLCINLLMHTWRVIKLKNTEKVPDGRARGSMIVSGEMRSKTSELYLCVFGGVREDAEDMDAITYLDTFAVANLSKGLWTIPNGRLPGATGPMGIHPGLSKLRMEQNEDELILVLRGAIGRQIDGTNKISRTRVDFSKALLFNPRSRINQFMEMDSDVTSRLPHPAASFIIQPSTRTNLFNEFVVVTCGKQRALNEFPGWASSSSYSQNLYIVPEVKIWIATLRELDDGSNPEINDAQRTDTETKFNHGTSSTEDDSTNSPSDSDATFESRSLRSRVLAQKAVRSGRQVLRRSGKFLTWRNVTGGRVKQFLENLSASFRVEAMFMSGDLSARCGPLDYSYNHPIVPRLVLLGSDHEFLGEVRSDVYNALAMAPLHSLVEADDDEALPETLSISDTSSMPGSSTPKYGVSEDEAFSVEESDHEFKSVRAVSSVNDSLSLRSTPEYEDGVFATSLDNHSDFVFPDECDVGDENLDSTLGHRSTGLDPFLIAPESEPDVLNTADFEIEALVENITYGPLDDSETENDEMEAD